MDRPDSPPSPLHSDESHRSADSIDRRSRKSAKEREKTNLGSRSKDLVRLLIREERESNDLRSMVQLLSERVSNEAHRADTAEANAREVAHRFKQANDARLAALQDSARLNEELQLYKLQLENAQREINRAQGLLDALEAQRFEAEESAARARTTARKLKEEKLVQIARDEGRIQGLKEGIAQGRLLGYQEGRAEGYARGRAAAAHELADKTISSTVVSSTTDSKLRDLTLPLGSAQNSPPPPGYPNPSAESIVVHSPPPIVQRSIPPPTSDNGEIHPVMIHTAPPSPQHAPVDFPPEGWIPTIDNDQRIRLPPPHELSASPYTPTSTPPPTRALSPSASDEPPLMIPPPMGRRPTVETIPDTDSVASAGATGPQRIRRRRPPSSPGSKTRCPRTTPGPPT